MSRKRAILSRSRARGQHIAALLERHPFGQHEAITPFFETREKSRYKFSSIFQSLSVWEMKYLTFKAARPISAPFGWKSYSVAEASAQGPKDPRKSATSLTRWHADRVGRSPLAAGPKAVQPRHGLSTSSIRVIFPAPASISNRNPSRMALSPGFSRLRLLSAHSLGSRL